MNALKKSSLIAVGSLLPLAAWGDDSGAKTSIQREAYDPRPSETRSGPPTARADDGRATSGMDRMDHSRTDMNRDMNRTHTTTGSGHGLGAGIERVPSDQLEHRVTASDLIGTKVVDREGREIGKVKDIGLSAVAPQLAGQNSALASTSAQSSRDTEAGATARTGSTDRDASSGLSQPWTRSGERETRVFVRPDRALEAGDALVAIPATQLHREGDALRVDLTREELRSVVSERDANRVSMNR